MPARCHETFQNAPRYNENAASLERVSELLKPDGMVIARLLVVDGDPEVRKHLQKSLEARGYEVLAASSGLEALERFEADPVDIIVLDLELHGGMDGIEVCRRAKALREDEPPAVVFLTAVSDVRAKVRSLEAGGDDFCVKPVDLDELDARLRVIVRWRSRATKLQDETTRYRKVALVDPLTDLANRRALETELERSWARLERGGRSLALHVIDIDRFKTFNDRYGHRTGDEVLRAVAGGVAGAIRKMDQAFRYGGEEFVVLAPEAGHAGAVSIAERIRAAVARTSVQMPPGELATLPVLSVTVSVGLAVAPDPGIPTAQALLEAADRALYDAKSSGRNRLAVAPRVAPQHGAAFTA